MGFASESGTPSTLPPLQAPLVPQQWADALHTISRTSQTPPIAVICGPKNSGKSTFSRLLLNSLLERYNRVGYLDTDVGQPEFFLPGCLSLHLVDECLPDLMSTSLREPESVLMRKNAHSMRDLRLSDYFKQCFPSSLNICTNKELAHALASIPPYQVHFSQVKITHLHCQVPKLEVFHSLNATIVGLAVSSTGPSSTGCTHWCVGLGIVRGIDVKNEMLYVITPVSLCKLEKVDILFQGFIEIPTSLLQVRGCISPYMSTNVLHKIPVKDL